MDNKWTPQQYWYMHWLATPRGDRPEGVPTLEEVCRRLGVLRADLMVWHELPGFREAVFGIVRGNLGWRISDILGALADKAVSGDVPAIKLALQICGLYQEGLVVTHQVRTYGADEILEAADFIDEWRRARFARPATDGGRPKLIGAGEGEGTSEV